MNVQVDIGLCVKNAEKTVGETIRSIMDQDYPRELMTLIVVDDESRDRTLSVILDYVSQANIPIRVFHTAGRGIGFARQLVVNNASSEYILWVDGDITIPKDHVRKQVQFMEQHPKVGKARGLWENYKGKRWVALLENFQVMEQRNKNMDTKDSKLTGIGGSIFRVKALKQIDGFDSNIKGAGEDIDVAARIRAAGWLLATSDTTFYHKFRETWKELWDQYYWYGYGGHYVLHKIREAFILWHRIPLIAFMIGLWRSMTTYLMTRRKISFLLSLQCFYKNVAWCTGFFMAHIDGYGHLSGGCLLKT